MNQLTGDGAPTSSSVSCDRVQFQSEMDKQLCRICVTETDSEKSINLFGTVPVSYSDKLNICFPSLNIMEADHLPNIICWRCCQLVDQTHDFYQLCIRSDRKLRDSWDVTFELKSELESDIKPELSVSIEEVKLSVQEEKLRKLRRNRRKCRDDRDRIYRKPRSRSECRDENGKYIRRERLLKDKCGVCERFFADKSSLEQHMRSHTGERPCICEICGKGFRSAGSVKVHLETHYDHVKRFECTKCSYRSAVEKNFKRHLLIHDDVAELQFSCTVCGKKTKTKCILNRHMKNVHSVLSLPCDICGKIFHTKETLKKHVDRHATNPIN